ncbi:MAG: hypothetical protein GY832_24050 [Chloroflexi bacterium]|nr:hypothetical protein [Chloroflexota bacterium]
MNKKRFALFIGLTLPLAALAILLSWMPGELTDSWQPVAEAQGTVITVTTDLDNGSGGDGPIDLTDCTAGDTDPCTLREAIQRANSLSNAHIIFSESMTITLTYRGQTNDGPYEAFASLSGANKSIDGDFLDDCVPDVIINGENLGSDLSGLRLVGNGGTIEGLVIQNVADGYGILIANGDNLTITCNYIGTDGSGRQAAPNRLGVYINREAYGNLVTDNVIAGNSQNGVQISHLRYLGVNYIPYSNTISNNWIGTNPFGDMLGNESKGVLIQHNAYNNLVYNNQIRYNGCYGVHLRGRKDEDEIYPPQGNQIISNTITNNNENACPGSGLTTARAGIVNEDTHLVLAGSAIIPSLGNADYDNLIADNLISNNGDPTLLEPKGFGIFNLGSSPLITGNIVQNNADHGIFNQVDFDSTYSPLDAADDILSIPIIQNNVVQNNGGHGIRSLDTSPVDPYQLHISNTVQNNDTWAGGKGINISQAWYGVIEALHGNGVTYTTHFTQSAAPIITNQTYYPEYRYELYHPISVGPPDVAYTSTIWSDSNSIDYFDVSTWQVVPQFIVTGSNQLEDYYPHDVIVDLQGGATLTSVYSYDGLTTTHPVTDFLVPAYVETGPFGRYQVAQVYFLWDLGTDSDDDGVDDDDECPGGPPCVDSDDDGIPDYLDEDSDGDGIPDTEECPSGIPCDDSDDDGIPDYLEDDSDNDGIPDADECPGGPPCTDTDNDDIPDYQDDDDDGDGILTEDECPGGEPCQDSDGDGTPDYIDDDDDGDGIPTEDEDANNNGDPTDDDTDGDGIPDYLDDDSDNDGIDDMTEAGCTDDDENGQAENCPTELPDQDNDGIPDYLENNNDDIDGDGVPNYLDDDSDGDGILDADEYYYGDGDTAFCTDETEDADGDGIPDCQDNDIDGDGILNYLDGDSDGDGNPDATECPGGAPCPDTGGITGIPDWIDDADDENGGGDSDGDGISDEDEAGDNPADPDDTDGDGIPNYLDTIEDIQSVTITGTSTGIVNTDYNLTANILPVTATTPVTYVWQVTGQAGEQHTGQGISDTFTFNGDTVGTYTITVTADNGSVHSDTHEITLAIGAIAPVTMHVSGPTTGSVIFTSTFMAAVEPVSVTTPITYIWQVEGQSPVVYGAQGLSNTHIVSWSVAGTYVVTVTAENDGGTISETHTITITDDTDNDSILDDIEHDWCSPDDPIPCDTDGDGIPDYQDTDSDGDGIPDSEEYETCSPSSSTCVCGFRSLPDCYVDSDGDYMPDWLDPTYYIYLPLVVRNL